MSVVSARIASRPAPLFTVSTSSSTRSVWRAAVATGVGVSSLPRPAGFGTRVTTRSIRCPDAANARSEGTDQRSLPRKTIRRERAMRWSLRWPERWTSALGALHLEFAELSHHVATSRVVEPIDVQHAAQAIGLVLKDAREQALGAEVERIAVQVLPSEPNALRPDGVVVRPGDRQASLLEGLLALQLGDLRVGREAAVALSVVVHEERLADAYLVGGQANTRRRVHRLEHVVDERAERVVERLDDRRGFAQHWVAQCSDRDHGHDRSPTSHRCGSASTRVTTFRTARRRIAAPNLPRSPGSSTTKHIVAPCVPETSNVRGERARSSASSPSPPLTRNTGEPTGKPASARRGASARSKRSARPETRAWIAGSLGAFVCTITRPSLRAQAAASNQAISARSRASTPGRCSDASAFRTPTRSSDWGPRSIRASSPPTKTSASSGGRAVSSRPSSDTGTRATDRTHSSTRSAPRRTTPKSEAPQDAHRPGAPQ